MKIFVSLIFITLLSMQHLQSQTPYQVVEQQLEAYNNGDIDQFMAVFSTEIELWTLGEPSPRAIGHEEVRKIYAQLFEQSPELFSEVITRSVIGNKVIDYERISGRQGGELLFLVMIYEVKEGKIIRATAIREN